MPSGVTTRSRIRSANGFFAASCAVRPASAKPGFEYENTVPGGSILYSPIHERA